MKTTTRLFPLNLAKTLIAGSAMLAAGSALAASTVVITAKTGTTVTPCPAYCETVPTLWSQSGSSSHSSAPGDNAGGSVFTLGTGVPEASVQPTLDSLGVYTVEVTHISGSCSANILVGMSATGGTISATQTDGFQLAHGINVWYKVCDFTNTSLTPKLTFTYLSGNYSSSGSRWYMDGFRFTPQGLPCQTVNALTVVNGPLADGQTFVNVPKVDTTSTNVTVYSDTGSGSLTMIGSLAVTNVTNAVVPVLPLVKGTFISATQWKAGQESCQATAGNGQLVGGGANTFLGVCLDMYQDASLTGPIGATGASTSSDLYFLGADGRKNNAFAGAPADPIMIQPSTCWQTVYIDPTTANYFHWNSVVGSTQDPNHFAELSDLALAIEDTDNGPYDIYIDDLKNGTNVLLDFESSTNGAVGIGFQAPHFATTPSGMLMAPLPGVTSPDIRAVSTNHAASGSKSLHVGWQFINTSVINWLRLVSVNHPQIDLTKPISFQILVLPVGQTNTGTNVTINTQPANTTAAVGDTATFNVTATGNSLSYQWFENGAMIPGANSSSYTTGTLADIDTGSVFQVQVSDSVLCPKFSNLATLTVGSTVVSTNITFTSTSTGIVLNWTGSHTLESSTNVTGPWSAVSGPILTGPYTNAYTGAAQFFRLHN